MLHHHHHHRTSRRRHSHHMSTNSDADAAVALVQKPHRLTLSPSVTTTTTTTTTTAAAAAASTPTTAATATSSATNESKWSCSKDQPQKQQQQQQQQQSPRRQRPTLLSLWSTRTLLVRRRQRPHERSQQTIQTMASSEEAEDELQVDANGRCNHTNSDNDDNNDRLATCFPSGIPLQVQIQRNSQRGNSNSSKRSTSRRRRAGKTTCEGQNDDNDDDGDEGDDSSDQEQQDEHDQDNDDEDELWWDPVDEWHQSRERVGEAHENNRHDKENNDDDDLSSTTFHSLDSSSLLLFELRPTTARGCYQRALVLLAAVTTTTTTPAAGPALHSGRLTAPVAMSQPWSVWNDEECQQMLQDTLDLCHEGLQLMITTKRSVETKLAEGEEEEEEENNSLLEEESNNDNHTEAAAVAKSYAENDNKDDEDEAVLTESLYWKLLQLKAQVLGRLGHYQESLHDHEQLLQLLRQQSHWHSGRTLQPPRDNSTMLLPATQALAVQANLLYACGRLSVYQKEYDRAISFYQDELEVTRALLQQTSASLEPAPAPAEPLQHSLHPPTTTSLSWLGTTTATTSALALSRIHHELARLHKVARGDGSRALQHYEQALQVELSVYQQLTRAAASLTPLTNCTKRQPNRTLPTKHGSRSLPGGGRQRGSCSCCSCARCTDLLETAQQIRETKRAMGRIHFEQGDFDKAVKLSL